MTRDRASGMSTSLSLRPLYILMLAGLLISGLLLPSSAGAAGVSELTLQEAYRQALDNNEDIRIAEEDLVQGRLFKKQAYSVLIPQLTANAGYSKLYFAGDFEVENTSYGISLSQAIYSGGRVFIALKGAKMNIAAAEYGLDFARQSVLMDLLARTYDVLTAEDLLGLEDERIERNSEQLRSARARFEVGEVAKTDVLVARVALATARKDRVEAEKNLLLSRRRLGDLIGLKQQVKVSPPRDVVIPGADLDELVRIAVAERKDLLQGNELIGVAVQEAREAGTRGLPDVDLSASHTEYSDVSPFVPESQVSLNITWPFFQGGLVKYQEQEAYSRVRQVEQAYAKQTKGVLFAVEEVYRELQTLMAQEELVETSLENARENYRLERIQFDVGDGTDLDVLVAHGGLSDAENQAVIHRYQTRVAKAALLYSIGRMSPDVLGILVDRQGQGNIR